MSWKFNLVCVFLLNTDSPTAEELMKAICPEKGDTRDSCLPPKPWANENLHMDRSVKLSELKNWHKIPIQFLCDSSGEQLEEKKRSQILEGTFYLETGSGLQPKLLGQSHPLTISKDSRSSEENPIHQQTWSIGQEVDRLMQDHNAGSSQLLSLDPKADKNPVSPTVCVYGGEATVFCSLQSISFNSSIYDIYSRCKRLKAGE